jgi:hypothetical protein
MSSGEILEILAFCIHAREKSWNIGSGAIRNRVAAKEAFPLKLRARKLSTIYRDIYLID